MDIRCSCQAPAYTGAIRFRQEEDRWLFDLNSATAAIALLSLCAFAVQAQDVRTTLFKDSDAAFQKARATDTALLSPANFDKAESYYARAEQNVQKGKSIEKIQEELAQANTYLRAAEEAAKLARVTFTATLESRNAALAAQAPKLAASQWESAEKEFDGAARKLEGGDVNKGKSRAGDALAEYRAAELTAIQGAILNEARRLVEKAQDEKADKYAPVSLNRAEALIARAERDLQTNRYATDVPRAMARDAEYEARHASFITTRALQIKDKDKTVEDIILNWEMPLREIATQLDSSTDLSSGYEVTQEASLARIRRLQEVDKSQAAEIDRLAARNLELEESLGITTALANAMEMRQRQVTALEQLFGRNEARIVQEGDKVIIRLIGLQFNSGEAVIESRYFGLLRKIADAADIFPDAAMVVEGHTDSVGSDQVNLTLSERRANSVRDYLLANTVLGASRVGAVGYGKTRPIANNETTAGRASNRRIDVVIIPAKR